MSRTYKELLTILRDNIVNKSEINSGLCLEANILTSRKIITIDEYFNLVWYIGHNRPKKGHKHFNYAWQHSCWYWPITKVKPRLDWLNTHINMLNQLP
jgi:hypothetical protein